MKKVFTLIVAAVMAASVNAQGTYAVQIGDNVTAGEKITSVENITLTYIENDGKAYAAGKKQSNWADADFTAYVCGVNSGKLNSGTEPTGCAYKFETVKAGSVTVAVQLAPTKGFHILDADFAEVAPASYNLPSAKDGDSQKFEQNAKGENIIAAKSNGTVTFNVVAGGTYYVLAAGTKMGFFGFKYDTVLTIGSEGVATYAASYPIDYNANNLEAYSVSYDATNNKLAFNKIDGVVAANTAVIVKGAAGDYTLAKATADATVTNTGLKASDGKKTGAENIYCLANKSEGLGFYQVSSTVTIPANKAYLEIPASAGARTFYSMEFGGGTTGINAIQANGVKANAAIYSLSGQQVSKAYKGIVIVNDKKMIQK